MPTQNVKCPNCNADIQLQQTVEEIANFGKMLFSVLHCEKCGFKLSDVMSLDFKKPVEYSAKISKPSHLSIKIIKSSTATIKIPELGVLIEPGPASDGYFSNIEGLLDRIQQVAEILVSSAKEPKEVKAADKALEKIHAARDSKFSFTVEVLDPFGNSALVGNSVKRILLSKQQAAKLKKPITVFQGN
ncbi:MAG: ZPR1 zinc finger domain-containing protein [Candidatus Diapherotrites archaeon]|nr:ZPR1 zinc finger domain-containing protein [Candidatus Diapherotrites archaeon]